MLRDLRQQARLKVKAAAAALEWSEPKLSRIETGQTAVRGLDAGPFTLLRFPSRGGAEPDEATIHVPCGARLLDLARLVGASGLR